MRYEGADSPKCLPVELEDDKHIQSTQHPGQHLGEAIHHISVRCLGQGRHEPQEVCPEEARRIWPSWQSSDVISATSINLFYHSARGREGKGCHLPTSVLIIV